MLRDFRDFVLRGNLLDLAVALVLGLAFAALVTSLVDNLIMPVVAAVIGEPDFGDLTFEVNGAVFGYGAFITDLIVFVATAAAVYFVVVRPVQALLERRAGGQPTEEEVTDEERRHRELLAAIERLGTR
jgi:large conductance mechanosensitive channel